MRFITGRKVPRSHRAVLAATAAAGLAAVLAAPAAAHADSFATIVNPATGLVLDVQGASTASSALIDMWVPNGQANQEWAFESSNVGGADWIVNENSGQCVTTDGVAGDQIYQKPCGSTKNPYVQAWIPEGAPDGSLYFVNELTGYALDIYGGNTSPGAAVDTWPFNDTWNQLFLAE